MSLTIGDTAPDFEADTTQGRIKFHDWIGDGWAVLFSHPRDFTPVCTTELGYMASIKPEFDKRDAKIIGLSVDPSSNHEKWAKDIEETQGTAPNYPMIADTDFAVSKAYGMLPPDVEGDPTERTPAQNATLRNVFVIGPDKKIKLVLIYPMSTGRNFDEVLRVLDSLQRTSQHQVATPAQWQPGDDVIISGTVSNDQAKERYPDGWEEPKPYIRIVPDPVRSAPGAQDPVSSSAFRRRRSARFARRIARSISGAPTFAKPAGSPRLRSVMRVPAPASAKPYVVSIGNGPCAVLMTSRSPVTSSRTS